MPEFCLGAWPWVRHGRSMRRGLAVILVVVALATACGKASVGGGPDGPGYMEQKKTSGPMIMITIVVAAAAVVGLMYIRDQNRAAMKNPP